MLMGRGVVVVIAASARTPFDAIVNDTSGPQDAKKGKWLARLARLPYGIACHTRPGLAPHGQEAKPLQGKCPWPRGESRFSETTERPLRLACMTKKTMLTQLLNGPRPVHLLNCPILPSEASKPEKLQAPLPNVTTEQLGDSKLISAYSMAKV